MAGFILGEKGTQSQTFTEEGERIPTTFILTEPCYLIDIKTKEKDSYDSLKLAFKQTKTIKKSNLGILTKAGIKTPLRFFKEIRINRQHDGVSLIEEKGKRGVVIGESKIFIGEKLNPLALFKKKEKVDVSGVSKGKGFQGVVKRHGFSGGPRTHGQSDRERAPGSIGQTTTPGRVYKGKRMAGRMGGKRVTVKDLIVVEVKEKGILVKGLIPGAKNGLLEVRTSKKTWKKN